MVEERKDNKIGRIAIIVVNCVFYLFILLLLVFSISNLKQNTIVDIPNIFGKGYLTVLTGSMDGEEKDSFSTDDLIFVKVLNEKNKKSLIEKLEVGDIVTFEYYSNEFGTAVLNSHRIVDFISEDGKDYVITQGDFYAMNPEYKYEASDDTHLYVEKIPVNSIKAIYTGKLNGVGGMFKFLQTSTGFLTCIVLPTAVFFIFEAIILVSNFLKIKGFKKEALRQQEHEEELARIKADLEKEKEKIRAEIMAEMTKEKEEN